MFLSSVSVPFSASLSQNSSPSLTHTVLVLPLLFHKGRRLSERSINYHSQNQPAHNIHPSGLASSSALLGLNFYLRFRKKISGTALDLSWFGWNNNPALFCYLPPFLLTFSLNLYPHNGYLSPAPFTTSFPPETWRTDDLLSLCKSDLSWPSLKLLFWK